MKKTILLLFAFLICIQFSYCQKSDTVNLKNTMFETSRYINRSLVAAQVGGVLAATGAAMCFIGIKSYSTTFVSKSPLYFSGLCCVGSAVCLFIIVNNLKKAGVKLNRLDFKNNSLIIKID